jgi:alpha-L-fucosidase 2
MQYDLTPHNLHFTKMPEKWIDGIFLGNGDIGAMIWGDGAPLKISLDKIDFWENRMHEDGQFGPEHNWEDMQKLIAEKNHVKLVEKYQLYMSKSGDTWKVQPTRLPVPRLEINLNKIWSDCSIELDLYNAMIKGYLENDNENGKGLPKIEIKSFIHADLNCFTIELKLNDNISNSTVDLKDSPIKIDYQHLDDKAKANLKAWGYPDLDSGIKNLANGIQMHYTFQCIPENQGGLLFTWIEIKSKSSLQLTLFMHSKNDLKNPTESTEYFKDLLDLATEKMENYLNKTEEEKTKKHLEFWHTYWSKSAISIPDNIIENLYYVELYKLACNTRYGKFPCPLQGVWTLDGTMPPWAGDYHIDMNVQETYWPIYASNHLELGEPLFRVMTDLLPKFEKICKDFYQCDGILTTCSISLEGENLHGYYNTEVWPGNSAWLAHMFWLYWRYSKDKCFLKQKAYPYMKKSMQVYEHLLVKDSSGEYNLPLSSSPEFHENQIKAWGKNTNCDLALIQWLVNSLLETVTILKIEKEPTLQDSIEKWKDIKENLVYYPADYDGLMVWEDQPYDYSHRHMTHLFAIHPFHLVSVEGDRDDQFLVKSSIKNLRKIGSWEYTGWTLPWLSMFASWANNYWLAYRWIRDYLGFIKDNSMHINGDFNDHGICGHVYEPMTLEAGFCFINAVIEMLMKSWSGIIRVFEGLPASWHDVHFVDLRAEGAYLVSASLTEDNLDWIIIKSERGGICQIKNTFLGKCCKLTVFDTNSNEIIAEIDEKTVIGEFNSIENGQYLIIPNFEEKKMDSKRLMEEILQNYETFRDCSKIFNGNKWFGLKSVKRNPYLP